MSFRSDLAWKTTGYQVRRPSSRVFQVLNSMTTLHLSFKGSVKKMVSVKMTT